MPLEKINRPVPGIRNFFADISSTHLANGFIAFLFSASAPVAIVLGVGAKGGLTEQELASWMFGGLAFNGLVSIFVTIVYRQPLVFFWTISGSVLVGPAFGHLTFPEIIGAFYATGLLLLILGLTGSVGWIMRHLPMPIIMGMVAGVFLQFGIDWIVALKNDFWIAFPMTAAFFLFSFHPAVARRMPPMIGVLVIGVIAVVLQGSFNPAGKEIALNMVEPIIFTPVFSWQAMIELVVPISITVLAAQNAQGIGILKANGHNPPVNTITTTCGGMSIVCAAVGTVSTCLTGPVNAILSSGGTKESQYSAAIFICLLAILFGLYSPVLTKSMLAAPPAFIATLAGLALFRVLQNSFVASFQRSFTLGALTAFLVTVSDLTLFNIGSPFWGLLFGFITSWILERTDFRTLEGQSKNQ
ncbi:MAG: benzoate transporter [Rhodospirillaceae bacterium]|jgi:benzoate membrane transport protein|nr:benzoate transporter [Rhodospirillaceae bacterium]